MKQGKSELSDRLFWLATEDEIKTSKTTDVYFNYTSDVLKRQKVSPEVVMQVYARAVPYSENWGVVTGIYEVAKLLQGLPIDVKGMEEGEIFQCSTESVIYEPVLEIRGKYTSFAQYENPILGLLGTSSSVSTKSARIRSSIGDKLAYSFGSRRAHPALAPTIERAAYIGGVDNVSNTLAARLLGKKPVGTMPHALVQVLGDPRKAWSAFHSGVAKGVPRIALIDTFYDEKQEAIDAFALLGKNLEGIRLDTPSSRKGDWRKIIEEVRWELAIRGGKKVKVIVSGGLDEDEINTVKDIVDGFGVGTSISAPPVIDFCAKIVEVPGSENQYRAKRGDISGSKQVYRKNGTFQDIVAPSRDRSPKGCRPLLTDIMKKGKIIEDFEPVDEIRRRVLNSIKSLASNKRSISWDIA
ncbi:MAG: nicotinate phosphoribosyltransferase [Nitrososphaerales archaeon]